MPTGVLQVSIVEGRGLKNLNFIGENDPYVEIYLDKKYRQRTLKVKNTNNPTWNDQVTFNIRKGDNTIHFTVYNSDFMGRGTIGKCQINLQRAFQEGETDEWLKLPCHLGLSSNGEIHVKMNFVASDSS